VCVDAVCIGTCAVHSCAALLPVCACSQNVGDLRLLIQEGMLRTLGLPLRLCVWIEEELSKMSTPVAAEIKSDVPDLVSAESKSMRPAAVHDVHSLSI